MTTKTATANEKAHSPANSPTRERRAELAVIWAAITPFDRYAACIVKCHFCGCEFDHADTAHTNPFTQDMCSLCLHRYEKGGRS